MIEENKELSEFGKGLTYCLGLFLAHAERKIIELPGFSDGYEMWFNGASDHVYEINVPDTFPSEIKQRIEIFREKVLNWGHGFKIPGADKDAFEWSIQEAKDLLLLIDKHIGTETEQGRWE